VQPSNKIGEKILYGIPVPFNPDFGRGLNAQGGVNTPPGQNAIRPTGFVVNPTIKTSTAQAGFEPAARSGTAGSSKWIRRDSSVNLERIDDVNRFAGDLLDGRKTASTELQHAVARHQRRIRANMMTLSAPQTSKRFQCRRLQMVEMAGHLVRHFDRVPPTTRTRQGRGQC
jgi:hypothetical protein